MCRALHIVSKTSDRRVLWGMVSQKKKKETVAEPSKSTIKILLWESEVLGRLAAQLAGVCCNLVGSSSNSQEKSYLSWDFVDLAEWVIKKENMQKFLRSGSFHSLRVISQEGMHLLCLQLQWLSLCMCNFYNNHLLKSQIEQLSNTLGWAWSDITYPFSGYMSTGSRLV